VPGRDLLAIEIGGRWPALEHQCAVGAKPDGLASGEAVTAHEDAIEGLENFGRAVFRCAGAAHP